MADYRTPGVYVKELDAFPPSIVGVQTAVPAFIGFTEQASLNGKSVYEKPIKIESMADFTAIFGEGYEGKYNIQTGSATDYDVVIGGNYDKLTQDGDTKFYLYNSMRFFYDNGGGTCFVVSVGDYTATVDLATLKKGLKVIKDQVGPTMLVVPDALRLDEADFYTFTNEMLTQCSDLKDRMAILDVHGIESAGSDADPNAKLDQLVAVFREKVSLFLNYGAAYAPALATSIVPPSEITYANFTDAGLTTLKAQLDQEADLLYPPPDPRNGPVKLMISQMSSTTYDQALDQNLTAALPVLAQAYAVIAAQLGVLPPSGAMAGAYTLTDRTRGVWNAPANLSLISVLRPTVKITSQQQEDLNVPLDGKAINAIREFVGKGTVVWGARTLDGNSNDWRYIQVRRTLLYIEQSIKSALDKFVFAPNDGKTWAAVVSMISNFLQGVWTQGGLFGATASDAFTVQCGLNSTMTPLDILNGYMVVQVTLALLRPAEFIELTFKQQMPK